MSWRDNPIVVATISIVATATFMVVVVLPIWLQSKDNQIATLRAEPTNLKARLADLTSQLQTMESANLRLRQQLDRLSPNSIFSIDDVYPRGFRSVRIGDRTDLIAKVYGSDGTISEDDGPWVSVDFRKPNPFSRITFYYDENARLKTVTSILFHFDKDGRTFELLKQELIDRYGQSKMKEIKTYHKKTELEWSGVNKHVLKLGDGTFLVDKLE
jgi:hypothetical protein